MKPFEVRASSWHYRLTERLSKGKHFDADFCTYWRSFTIALIQHGFAFALVGAILLGALALTCYALWTVVITAYTGNVTEESWFCALGLSAVLAAYLGIEISDRRQTERWNGKERKKLIDWQKAKDNSIIVQAYRSHRGKFCIPLRVIRDEESSAE